MRWFWRILAAGLLIATLTTPASALVMAARTPIQRAATADVVIVGKVTAIEKETVEALPFPKAPNKIAYKIAVVKVETPLAGAENLTHVKVAFLPRPAPNPNPQPGLVRPRPGLLVPELKENDEFLFFLSKHPDGGFYAMSNMSPPIAVGDEEGKKTLDAVNKVTKALADPMKGLKSENAEDRYLTAGALLTRYRNYPDFTSGGVDQQDIAADESKLILKIIAERDWTKPDPSGINPTQLFFSLGLTEKDEWKMPKPQPGMNFNALLKADYLLWLDGAGKDYRIKHLVAKK